MPRSPSSANSGTISFGKTASSYHSLMLGLIRSCTNERTCSLMLFSSSERWASIFRKSCTPGLPKASVSAFLPACVTVILLPLSELSLLTGIISQRTFPRCERHLSTLRAVGHCRYPALHWSHGGPSEVAARRRKGSGSLASSGGTLRDDGPGGSRCRRDKGGASRTRRRYP